MKFRNIQLGWRNIRKNSVISIINISSLSIALAVVILILFWLVHELNYDKFHVNLERIYTVYEHQEYSEGHELYTNCTPFPLSETINNEYPEVELASTYLYLYSKLLKHDDKEFNVDRVLCADTNFMEIFSYNILKGDPNTLSYNDKVILTKDMAERIFGDRQAIGETIEMDDRSFTVGAIIDGKEGNSTQNFKAIYNLQVLKLYGTDLTNWGNNWPNTSVLLAHAAHPDSLEAKITGLCKDHGQENTSLHVFPHKNERLYSYSGKGNRIQYVFQFMAIACIIIIIATINFINLSVAKAEQRRPEVQMHTVLGANQRIILRQFITEKCIMLMLALAVSAVLVQLLMPLFQTLSEKHITADIFFNKYMIVMLVIVLATIMLLSVAYPAIYLTRFGTARTGKKTYGNGAAGNRFKSILVIVQFALAIVLISTTILISKQLTYINRYDLGYSHANLVHMRLDGGAYDKHQALKDELAKIPGVKGVTRSDKLPLWGGNSSWGHTWEGKDPENKVLICKMHVDKDYFTTMGIKMAEGEGFPELYNKVQNPDEIGNVKIVLNREAIRRMQLENPVGKSFRPWDSYDGTIVGVTDNFHFESLHRPVEPMFMIPMIEKPEFIIANISSDNFSQTIDNIKETWAEVAPNTTCEVAFFDDYIKWLYAEEGRISSLFRYFTIIAIFVSCIGLFGLSLFVIERRINEIGIRKVNGAQIKEILVMLNTGFASWVLIAVVIACPLSYYAMTKWLQNFTCKTPVSWWIFVLAGCIALGIALLTVSWQSWRAASRNPVESLRYE